MRIDADSVNLLDAIGNTSLIQLRRVVPQIPTHQAWV